MSQNEEVKNLLGITEGFGDILLLDISAQVSTTEKLFTLSPVEVGADMLRQLKAQICNVLDDKSIKLYEIKMRYKGK